MQTPLSSTYLFALLLLHLPIKSVRGHREPVSKFTLVDNPYFCTILVFETTMSKQYHPEPTGCEFDSQDLPQGHNSNYVKRCSLNVSVATEVKYAKWILLPFRNHHILMILLLCGSMGVCVPNAYFPGIDILGLNCPAKRNWRGTRPAATTNKQATAYRDTSNTAMPPPKGSVLGAKHSS